MLCSMQVRLQIGAFFFASPSGNGRGRRPSAHSTLRLPVIRKHYPRLRSLTRTLASDNSITEDAPMGNESTSSLEQAERVDHQLVRGIGIPALTANIVSSTIGAGIFVIPAMVAKGLGSAAPLAFVCCAIAMIL